MKKEQLATRLHGTMAVIGGFLGAYALINHHDIFGSAQTTNMIGLIHCIVGADFEEMMLRIIMLLIYMASLTISVLVARYTSLYLHRVSIILNAVGIVIIALLPDTVNDFIALYPLCFIMAFQWNSFPGAEGYTSSCIFSTNNLKQFTTSTVQYLIGREAQYQKKMKFFGFVLLAYHIGVLCSCISCKLFGRGGAFVCLIPVLIAAVQVYREREKQEESLSVNIHV